MKNIKMEKALEYVFFAPIVVLDPSWGVPEHLKDTITLLRIAHLHTIMEKEMATEFEAMLYLYNASLTSPLAYEWAIIYQKLFYKNRKYIGFDDDTFPPDLIPDNPEFTDYETHELNRLRGWIFRRQI